MVSSLDSRTTFDSRLKERPSHKGPLLVQSLDLHLTNFMTLLAYATKAAQNIFQLGSFLFDGLSFWLSVVSRAFFCCRWTLSVHGGVS